MAHRALLRSNIGRHLHRIRPRTSIRTTQVCFLRENELVVPLALSRSALRSTRSFSSAITTDEPSIEEQYTKLTQIEHILNRPSMYIGSNKRGESVATHVLNELETLEIVSKQVRLVPALGKIFDEILVNASDNHLRHPRLCNKIEVVIERGGETSPAYIKIYNNGPGIPISMHKKENMYVPEMLFGNLLTGSNFNDNEKRITGGRHGFGAKLTNIFSKSFTLSTGYKKKKYSQTWRNNMSEKGDPVIEKYSGDEFTCLEFVPDIQKLTGEESRALSHDDYSFMCRRVIDVAGCSAGKLQVKLNGVDVSQKSFRHYCELFRPTEMLEYKMKRWNICVGRSETDGFEQVSFVNGIHTSRGGTHVDVIVAQIVQRVLEIIEKKNPELKKIAKPSFIKKHLFLGCDAQIENPSFDTQMKECLTSHPTSFGSSYDLPKKFLDSIVKAEDKGGLGIVEEIRRNAQGREQASLLKAVGGGKKTQRQILAIEKLEDAYSAGSGDSANCTVILTEGDSAKALAVAGLEIVGRECFGVFPLRGKFLNVRDASTDQLKKNKEVKALCSILGLDFNKTYATQAERKKLRYGRVMIMTDQDADGSHIKGLIMNFFRHFWPKLLKPPEDLPDSVARTSPPFLAAFVTPLLKASSKSRKETLAFYSMAEYRAWRNSVDVDQWKIKYYKGLGTSTTAEAKEYFSAFDHNLRPYRWNSDRDGEKLDMVFDKKRAAERRTWILNEFDPDVGVEVDPSEGNVVSYEDFVNKEMIHFSHADNIRSIPSAIDGLKPSQRKVLYACFKRKLKGEIKVAQLTGYIAEHTAYHHGEASLQTTVIRMAQDYVGSNNINLLVPSGQFGTRANGGSDAGSPRYLFTDLSPITRYLFPEADDDLLDRREDDGQLIEPWFYCPIIPMLLVNGSQGIGTGWSTFIPPYDPKDVLAHIRARLDDAVELPPIRPFARDFVGSIEPKPNGGGYFSFGRASKESPTSVLIDELPLGCWTNDYKANLVKMVDRGEILSFTENHTDKKVSFTVTMSGDKMAEVQGKFEQVFELKGNLSTNNMHAFNQNMVMVKFDSPEKIVDVFFPVRMRLYEDRKSVIESVAKYEAMLLRNKARFVEAVISGDVDLTSGRKSRKDTVSRLAELEFETLSHLDLIRNDNDWYRRKSSPAVPEENHLNDLTFGNHDFDYLLNMSISSLTSDKIIEMRQKAADQDKKFEIAKATTASDLWRQDLDKLSAQL